MVLIIVGLSLIAAVIEGGGAMIGAFAINIASHIAVEAVGEQSKYSHFSTKGNPRAKNRCLI